MRNPARNSILVLLTAACSYPAPDDVLPLQLLAVEPSIANTGDTIMLEGTFASTVNDTVMINFPGGVARPADILGPHRARVVVPAAAGAGDLHATRGKEKAGPVAFRGVSFDLELQAFRELPGVRLVSARSFSTGAVVKNHVYVLGGLVEEGGGTTFLNSIEHATTDTHGSLGSFGNADFALLKPRAAHSIAVVGNRLYVLGGFNEDGLVPSVEYAPISSDGRLGEFTEVPGVTLQRQRHSSVVLGNSLYVLGGTAISVERATINPDGSLEAFSVVADVDVASGVTRRLGLVITVEGDGLYAVGGFDEQSRAGVDRASISADGLLGRFVATSVNLATSRADASTVVLGKIHYVLGGITLRSGPLESGLFEWLDSIERASIDDNRSPLAATPTLATARRGAASTVVGDHVYMLGGDKSHVALDSVERAAIHVGD